MSVGVDSKQLFEPEANWISTGAPTRANACPFCKTAECLTLEKGYYAAAIPDNWVECGVCHMAGPHAKGMDKVGAVENWNLVVRR